MTEQQAMRMALEALEYVHEGANNQGPHTGISWRCVSNKTEPVITALRQALDVASNDTSQERVAETEKREHDEPVAWGIVASNTGKICQVGLDAEEVAQHNQKYIVPLYTRPQPAAPVIDESAAKRIATSLGWEPKRKPLTDEEIHAISKATHFQSKPVTAFARAIEAALRSKNT